MDASDAPSVIASNGHAQQAEQNQVTQQHLSFLQAPFNLDSSPFSSTSDSSQQQPHLHHHQQQQQQPQLQQQQQQLYTPTASLSTPEAHWSEYT